jgi:hypothetical protein
VNIPARLGYVPVNKAGDTFTGLVSIQGVGLAAGIRCYNTVANRDYRVIQKDDGSLQITDETDGVVRFAITSSGTIYHGTTDLMWHSGNDGAGSGLDADLLDGRQASDFALLSGAQFQGNGTGIVGSGDWALFSLRNNQGSASAVGNTSIESVNENGIVVSSMQSLCDADGKSTIAFVTTPAGSRTTDRRQTAAYIRGPGPHGLLRQRDVPQRQSPLAVGQRRRGLRARCRSARWAAGQLVRGHHRPTGLCPGATGHRYRPAVQCDQDWLERQQVAADRRHLRSGQHRHRAQSGEFDPERERRLCAAQQQPLVGPGQRRFRLGLDADLLDGFQADAFARITAQSIGSTGYMVLSNG